ncbi:isoflavone reductase family protein-like protein CipA [Lojkania enalia]|uniref:Isoflavone reductase family protein-like protein CipA n=1 Tax=Lojkania enalia TaxID=147567 RepID=A0A9P4K3D3_9PLEO|nr:isoflavone reductase family protein-like protein CipA [Didymosphaeria enalia]
MSSEIKNVVIIGAGGNLGPSILNVFLESSSFNVTVLSRQESKATFPAGVNVVKADYSSIDSLKSAFQGQDAVISLVAGSAIGDQQKLIDGAIAAGVKRFLPSEYGSNTEDKRVIAAVPIFKGKVAVIDYLKSKESEISWTSVITGPFFDWCLKVGFLCINLPSKSATLIDEGKAKFSATNLHQIGLALIKILEKPSETKNKFVYISSFTTTQNDILAAAEKLTGEKFKVDHVSSKDLQASGSEKLGKGDFSGIAELIQASAFGAQELCDLTPAGLWNDKLGLEKESFEDSIKSVLNGKLVGEK